MWSTDKSNQIDYQFALAVGGFSSMIGTLSQSPLFVGIVTTLVALIVRHYLEKPARSASDTVSEHLLQAAELKGFLEGRKYERFKILNEVEKDNESK